MQDTAVGYIESQDVGSLEQGAIALIYDNTGRRSIMRDYLIVDAQLSLENLCIPN